MTSTSYSLGSGDILSTIQQHVSKAQDLISKPEASDIRSAKGGQIRSELKQLIGQINSEAERLIGLPTSDNAASQLLSLKKSVVALNEKVERLDEAIKSTKKEEHLPTVLTGLVAKATMKQRMDILKQKAVPTDSLNQRMLSLGKNGIWAVSRTEKETEFELRVTLKKEIGQPLVQKYVVQVSEEGFKLPALANRISNTFTGVLEATQAVLSFSEGEKSNYNEQVSGLLSIATEPGMPKTEEDAKKLLQKSSSGTYAIIPDNLDKGTFKLVYKTAKDEIKTKLLEVTSEGKIHVGKINFTSLDTCCSRFHLEQPVNAKLAKAQEQATKIAERKTHVEAIKTALFRHNRQITPEQVETAPNAMKTLRYAIEQLGSRAEGAYLFFEEENRFVLAHVQNGMIDQIEIDPSQFTTRSLQEQLKKIVPTLSDSLSWARDAKKIANAHGALLQGSAPSTEDYKTHPVELQALLGALGGAATGGYVIYPGKNAQMLSADVVVEGPRIEHVEIDLAREPGKMYFGDKSYDNVKDLIDALGGKLSIAQLRELKTKQLGVSRDVLKHQNYDYKVHTADDAAGKLAGYIETLKDSGVQAGWLVSAAPQAKSSGYLLGALSWVVPSRVASAARYAGELSGLKEAGATYIISALSRQSDGKYVLTEHAVEIDPQGTQFRYKNGFFSSIDAVAEAIKNEKGLTSLQSLSELDSKRAMIDNCNKALKRDAGFYSKANLMGWMAKMGSTKSPSLPDLPTLDSAEEHLFKLKLESIGPTYLVYPETETKKLSCQIPKGPVEKTVHTEHFTLAFFNDKGERHRYEIDLDSTPGQYTLKDENGKKIETYHTFKAALDACDEELVPFSSRWAEYQEVRTTPPPTFAQTVMVAKEPGIAQKPEETKPGQAKAAPTPAVKEEESLVEKLMGLTLQPAKPTFHKQPGDDLTDLLQKQWDEVHGVKRTAAEPTDETKKVPPKEGKPESLTG